MTKRPYEHLSNEAFIRIRRAAIWRAACVKEMVALNYEAHCRAAAALAAFARSLAKKEA